MRIFSNFDTSLKRRSYIKYSELHGEENILVLSKGWLYALFKIWFPLIIFLIGGIVIVILIFSLFGKSIGTYILLIIIGLGLLSIVITLFKNIIEYYMDFAVVTPKMLIVYDQRGIFKRHIMTINSENIRTISIVRDGFLYSVFNHGDIVFLSEGEMEHGEVTLHYIYKPEKNRHSIAQILKRI